MQMQTQGEHALRPRGSMPSDPPSSAPSSIFFLASVNLSQDLTPACMLSKLVLIISCYSVPQLQCMSMQVGIWSPIDWLYRILYGKCIFQLKYETDVDVDLGGACPQTQGEHALRPPQQCPQQYLFFGICKFILGSDSCMYVI